MAKNETTQAAAINAVNNTATSAKETATKVANETKAKAYKAASSAKEQLANLNISNKAGELSDKTVTTFTPITKKVRDLVLNFGEIIVTIAVIAGIISSVVSGFASEGFFNGLGVMVKGISTTIMGALIVFLLFAIKDKK